MDQIIRERIREWTSPPYDRESIEEIQNLVDSNNTQELIDRFYTELEFGTGGLRGILGAGTNRINIYNVKKVTQGLANYIIKNNGQDRGVVIGRDSRIMSDKFAQTVAGVMLANQIKVFYYKDIHPTPTVSFAIRELNSQAGIMITASHNPKQYNGYKVFWDNGAQVTPPHDKAIIDEVKKITQLSQVKEIPFEKAQDHPYFQYIDDKIDPLYILKTKSLSIHPEIPPSSDIKICYSPLHGTGYKLIPEALKTYGFRQVIPVEAQSIPDGTFPTAPKPNPEIIEAMQLGIEVAKQNSAEIFVASDPDADRIGVAIRGDDDEYVLLNGNQIAVLMVYYILSELTNMNKMPKNPRMISTIVTTDLIYKIAEDYEVGTYTTLTGFKWIGKLISEFQNTGETYVFGCEESHGYNAAEFVRDKDAVNATCLFCELTTFYKSKGISVIQLLNDIYRKYGYYQNSQVSIEMSGKEGAERIREIMNSLRNNPPNAIGRFEVLSLMDIMYDKIVNLKTGEVKPTGLPSSNVIGLYLSEQAKVIARPSGTEPKIKFYFTTHSPVVNTELESVKAKVNQDHIYLKDSFLNLLQIEH